MPLKQRHKHTQTDAKHQPEQIYVLCPPGNREEDVPTECCVVYTSHQFECQTQQHRQREEQQISKLEAHPLFLSVCVCVYVCLGGDEHARKMRKNFFPQTSLGMCYVPVEPTSFLKHLVCITVGHALPENTDEHVRAHTQTTGSTLQQSN